AGTRSAAVQRDRNAQARRTRRPRLRFGLHVRRLLRLPVPPAGRRNGGGGFDLRAGPSRGADAPVRGSVGALGAVAGVARAGYLNRGPKRSARIPHCSMKPLRSEEHTSELQSLAYLVCRLLLE